MKYLFFIFLLFTFIQAEHEIVTRNERTDVTSSRLEPCITGLINAIVGASYNLLINLELVTIGLVGITADISKIITTFASTLSANPFSLLHDEIFKSAFVQSLPSSAQISFSDGYFAGLIKYLSGEDTSYLFTQTGLTTAEVQAGCVAGLARAGL